MNMCRRAFCTGMAILAMAGGCHSSTSVVEPKDLAPEPPVEVGEDAETQRGPAEVSPPVKAPEGAEDETGTGPESPLPPVPLVEPLCQPEMVLIPPGPDTSPFLTGEHFLLDWHVLGPFPFETGDFQREQQQDVVDFPFIAGEANLTKDFPAPANTSWQCTVPMRGKQPVGMVDLGLLYGSMDYVCAYAVTTFSVPTAEEAVTLRVGSDDYIKIWLNGELIHTYNMERRSGDWDQDVIDGIILRQGCNRLVVKCIDIVGFWDFSLRFTDSNGMPFKVVPLPSRE